MSKKEDELADKFNDAVKDIYAARCDQPENTFSLRDVCNKIFPEGWFFDHQERSWYGPVDREGKQNIGVAIGFGKDRHLSIFAARAAPTDTPPGHDNDNSNPPKRQVLTLEELNAMQVSRARAFPGIQSGL